MNERISGYLINHIALPPVLPQSSDATFLAGRKALTQALVKAARNFRSLLGEKGYNTWSSVVRMLESYKRLHDTEAYNAATLKTALDELSSVSASFVVLYIEAQNAAIMMRKEKDEYLIEAWESSPKAEDVLACKRLQCDFPGRAVAVPAKIFEDVKFQEQLIAFLMKANIEDIKDLMAISLKARSNAYESRDTGHPALVGDLLMALLEANGHIVAAPITRKHVRDDVLWHDAEVPWRRSPEWLVLRVAIQRTLCLLLDGEGAIGFIHYKFFTAFVLESLCNETVNLASPTQLSHMNAKLGRRLTKLLLEKEKATPKLQAEYDAMFSIFGNRAEATLDVTAKTLQRTWDSIRLGSRKIVPTLPSRASGQDLVLSLEHSGAYLRNIMQPVMFHDERRPPPSLKSYVPPYPKQLKIQSQAGHDLYAYLDLASFEASVADDMDFDAHKLKKTIVTYVSNAKAAYAGLPDQLSLMSLRAMELWVMLDKIATAHFPLLADHPMGFPKDLMNTLQAPTANDMKRLHAVEMYIISRHSQAKPHLPGIFDDPVRNCFAERFFDQNAELQKLHSKIELENENLREEKEEEWEEMMDEYEELMTKINGMACLFERNEFSQVLEHDDRHCQKCYLTRVSRRMKIEVHEDLLPEDPVMAKALVFELGLPSAFAAWRDTTWFILRELARPAQATDKPPILLLKDYTPLTQFHKSGSSTLAFASKTKSFLHTHYSSIRLPVTLDKILLSHGLKYALFDTTAGIWTARQGQKHPTFAELCKPTLNGPSPFLWLEAALHPVQGVTGATSNDVLAWQTRCPGGMTVVEGMSFQDLRIGENLSWPRLLRELASNNLNFGVEAISTLVTQLALQAGSPSDHGVLRKTHWVFEDKPFCDALLEQVSKRVEASAANWRESDSLDCLLTILLRLYSLTSLRSCREAAKQELLKVRQLSLRWARALRKEVFAATDAALAKRRSVDTIKAALLCRRTFAIEGQSEAVVLQANDAANFLELGIILNENLPKKISDMTQSLRLRYVRDIKLVERLHERLVGVVEHDNNVVTMAINSIWPSPAGSPIRRFTAWNFLPRPDAHWLTASTISSRNTEASQTLHLNILEGTLFIDGTNLGKLPSQFADDEVVHSLFGPRVFWIWPSSSGAGLKFVSAALIEGHQIHFGLRNGKVFVRIVTPGRVPSILEHIPAGIFRGSNIHLAPDLPLPLITNRVHLLDIQTGIVHVRPETEMWKFKSSHWQLNVLTHEALRRGKSRLVDPRSRLFAIIASLIVPFENLTRIIVYQPENGALAIHLPHLELDFRVTAGGLLYSNQLRALIDRDQDAGCLYGLASKLVLRDPQDQQRSVLVTYGTPTYDRVGNHVDVRMLNPEFYCRFPINKVLRRLDRPVEPALLYLQAYLHAVTTFVLPDPLTGLTGTEEALSLLSSGAAQPWKPLNQREYSILTGLNALTPIRLWQYDLKCLQNVVRDPRLPLHVQHDDFAPVVSRIMSRSQALKDFSLTTVIDAVNDPRGAPHLQLRARSRCFTHRPIATSVSENTLEDSIYVSRVGRSSGRYRRVLKHVSLVLKWSTSLDVEQDLLGVFQQWSSFQGYSHDLQITLMNDMIHLDVPSHWGSLLNHCLTSAGDLWRFSFWFATLSFNKNIDDRLIETLMAFAIMPEFKALTPPRTPLYKHYRADQIPTLDALVDLMRPACVTYSEMDQETKSYMSRKQLRLLEQEQSRHEQLIEDHCKIFARHILAQWPVASPSRSGCAETALLDTELAWQLIEPEWNLFVSNYEHTEFVKQLQRILSTCKAGHSPDLVTSGGHLDQLIYASSTLTNSVVPSIKDLLRTASVTASVLGSAPGPPNVDDLRNLTRQVKPPAREEVKSHAEIEELSKAVTIFSTSPNLTRQRYGHDLQASIKSFREVLVKDVAADIDRMQLSRIIKEKQDSLENCFKSLCEALSGGGQQRFLKHTSLWPKLLPTTVLSMLSSAACRSSLISTLVDYGTILTEYQRLLRVEHALLKNQVHIVKQEISNPLHATWRPADHPLWLLLEIENNIGIREEQIEVANAMMAPSSGQNAIVQLNMGLGKSSVIMPMIAAELATGTNLVRAVVPRALLLQSAQTLSSRLGHMIHRSVIHVPFARKSTTAQSHIKAYWELHKEIMKSRGLIVALPENLLSFKLSGLQCLSSGKVSEAQPMLNVQDWLHRKSRDIIDECDHILAVKTQLIYPSGAQSTVDGHPQRWTTAQALLTVVRSHLAQLRKDFPRGIEIIERPGGGYPMVYILRDEVKDALVLRVTMSLLNGAAGILPVKDCTQDDIEVMRTFLSTPKIPKDQAGKAAERFKERQAVWQDLLILRGLLVHRILLACLQKRWNVQYGLHPGRDPIAVPYLGLRVPSEQAEFGHPDMSILLTILSKYYAGLDSEEMTSALKQMARSDDPSLEFAKIVSQSHNMPAALSHFTQLNLDDVGQTRELYTYLRYNAALIDFHLNIIFPKHAKSFATKLVSSSWDLPLYMPQDSETPRGKENRRPGQAIPPCTTTLSTGFSGTNDARLLLPLTIQQLDLAQLKHTNAEVLTYLLQPRNRQCILAASLNKRLNERQLLEQLESRHIRILVDSGAQILELGNRELIQLWLSSVDIKAAAGVWFSESGLPMVTYRDGRNVPLSASPFANHLEDCVVYFDESHCRGTDLALPTHARAGLTLGPNQLKDSTVQAAMRLRRLGTTQSIVFFAPPEVHQSILDVRKHTSRRVGLTDSFDVIVWLLEQTTSAVEQLQPLYVSQGLDFCRRTLAARENPLASSDSSQRTTYLKAIEQKEQYSLEQLYAPKKAMKTSTADFTGHRDLTSFKQKLVEVKNNLRDTADTLQGIMHSEVEVEREVAVEIETVREVQKPHHATAAPVLPLHRDVSHFATTGRLAWSSAGFEQAFVALSRTAIGRKYGINDSAMHSKLYVTADFSNTIVTARMAPRDEYARAVTFFLWSDVSEAAMVISPHEAETLLPRLRDDAKPTTHLIAYVPPVVRSQLALGRKPLWSVPALRDWSMPSWLVLELGIFAGRLYYEDEETTALSQLLGLAVEAEQVSNNAAALSVTETTGATTAGKEHDGVAIKAEDPANDTGADADAENAVVDAIKTGANGVAEFVDSAVVQAELPAPAEPAKPLQPFSPRPLLFMQEWLTKLRRGQDISQTPIGYLTRGRRLEMSAESTAIPEQSSIEDGPVEISDSAEDVLDDVGDDIEDYGDVDDVVDGFDVEV